MLRRWMPWVVMGVFLAGGSALAAGSASAGSSTSARSSDSGKGSTPAGGKVYNKQDVKVDRLQQKRDAVDEMASQTMDRLLSHSPQAKRLFDKSVGYAVFDNFKVAVLVSGGGGIGVAVERSSRKHTYMKMGTAGIGIGLGGQSYALVFLFEDSETFRNFIEKGWHADATATAALWSKGASAEASFTRGLAVYQLTNKGVMAHLDISGTKYWKHRKLNAR